MSKRGRPIGSTMASKGLMSKDDQLLDFLKNNPEGETTEGLINHFNWSRGTVHGITSRLFTAGKINKRGKYG